MKEIGGRRWQEDGRKGGKKKEKERKKRKEKVLAGTQTRRANYFSPGGNRPRQRLRNPCTNGYATEAKYNATFASLFSPLFYFPVSNKGRICREAKLRRRQNLTRAPSPFPATPSPPFPQPPLLHLSIRIRFVKLLAHYEDRLCTRSPRRLM